MASQKSFYLQALSLEYSSDSAAGVKLKKGFKHTTDHHVQQRAMYCRKAVFE